MFVADASSSNMNHDNISWEWYLMQYAVQVHILPTTQERTLISSSHTLKNILPCLKEKSQIA